MALDFDRSSTQYLSRASAVISSAPFSVHFWFFWPTGHSTPDSGVFDIYTNGSSNNRFDIMLVGGASNRIRCNVRTTANAAWDTNNSFPEDAWIAGLVEYVSSTDRRSHWSEAGNLDTADSNGNNNTTNRAPSGMNVTEIGRSEAASNPMDGLIGQVAVWDESPLSTAERLALASGVHPINVRPHALVALWEMKETAGPSASLIRGGLDMTWNNSPTVAATHPPVAPPFWRRAPGGAIYTAAAPAGGPGAIYHHLQNLGVYA